MKNEYYALRNNDDEAVRWNPFSEEDLLTVNNRYFDKVAREIENRTDFGGYEIYLTWKIDRIPSHGNNVVAIVLGDEWCRTPFYADKVKAIFKWYGNNLPPTKGIKNRSTRFRLISKIQNVRTQIFRLPTELYAYTKNLIPENDICPIYSIPLGYANQKDLSIKPITERSTDLYFSGGLINSEEPWWSPRRWLKTPKQLSREQMVSQIREISQTHHDLNVELNLTQGPPSSHSVEKYSREMMDAKICVVPRGSSLETFRFFEALRYGCIVIREPLPSRWFYDGSPTIEIQDWSDLESIVMQVLSDEDKLRTKHNEGLAWWQNKCSASAVGTFIANRITDL